MRWFIGDLQGCVKELELFLEEVKFHPEHDELVCLGDLIRRGPDSLRLWRDVGGTGVIGNHEIHALHVADGLRVSKDEAVDRILSAPDGEELIQMIRELPVLQSYASKGHGPSVLAVHAGLHPSWTNTEERLAFFGALQSTPKWYQHADVSFATQVRCCTQDGTRSRYSGAPESAPKPYQPWDQYYGGTVFVVHGHWARRGFYRGAKTMGLDSGCVYGGALTAWCQDDDSIVQIPSQQPFR